MDDLLLHDVHLQIMFTQLSCMFQTFGVSVTERTAPVTAVMALPRLPVYRCARRPSPHQYTVMLTRVICINVVCVCYVSVVCVGIQSVLELVGYAFREQLCVNMLLVMLPAILSFSV